MIQLFTNTTDRNTLENGYTGGNTFFNSATARKGATNNKNTKDFEIALTAWNAKPDI